MKSAVRSVLFLLMTGGLLTLYLITYPFGQRLRRLFSYPFYRGCLSLTGLALSSNTAAINGRGTLFVANHVSYLDIPVLATLHDGVFVAKSDVKSWPLFGFLARIGRTIFVSRRASGLVRERSEIASRLANGESVFLFPEGTSSDGTRVLPFRAALLSAVQSDDELPVAVQPVSIAYGPESAEAEALGQDERDGYAWYGDMEMAPHLWRLLGFHKRVAVFVQFHQPRMSSEFADHRALAAWAESIISCGLKKALSVGPVQPFEPEYAPPVTVSP